MNDPTDSPRPRLPRDPLVAPGDADLHVADMTATLAADLALADAQARLAAVGQWLPIDGDPATPLGRLVLGNSTGPLRLGYGAWRDLLLGVQFTNGAGDLITAGGRTVKNVAGYDLTKFLVGSYGCFGTPVTITVRTHPRPAGGLVARFRPDPRLAGRLIASDARPQWAVVGRSGEATCGYLGDDATIRHHRHALPNLRPIAVQDSETLDHDVEVRGSLWEKSIGHGTFRAALPPGRLGEWAGRMSSLDSIDWCADLVFGVVVGREREPADAAAVDSALADLDGSVVRYDERGFPSRLHVPPGTRALLVRLKAAFDPSDRLPALPI